MRRILESGHNLPAPDGLHINGRGWNGYKFNVDQGTFAHEIKLRKNWRYPRAVTLSFSVEFLSFFFFQGRRTDLGYRMWGSRRPLTSESRAMLWSLLRWKDLTLSRLAFRRSTSIWDSPTLFWSRRISLPRTTTLSSRRVSPLECLRWRRFFTTATLIREFLDPSLVAPQLR